MNKTYYTRLWPVALVMVFLWLGVSCRDYRDDLHADGKARIRIAWESMVPAEQQITMRETRDGATPQDEKQVHNIYVFVFSQDGSQKITGEFFDKTKLKPIDGRVDYGTVEPARELVMGVPYKVYCIANINEGAVQSNTSVNKAVLDAVTNETELKAVVTSLTTQTADLLHSTMLMSGMKEHTFTESNLTLDFVPLTRNVAKVRFEIYDSPNFIPESYQVFNMPVRETLLAADADVTGVDTGADYFNMDAPRPLEGTGYGTFFVFYQYENRKPFTQSISETDPTKAYRLRARRKKSSTGETEPDKPSQTNGDFKYAPKYCTYVKITGTYTGDSKVESTGITKKIQARVEYTVPLGYVGKNINDYKVERNTSYLYKIRVTGAYEVIVEAERIDAGVTSDKEEYNPSTEGEAEELPTKYVLDSHYEQVLFAFTEDELLELDIDNAFVKVETPYGNVNFSYKDYKNNTLPADVRNKAEKLTKWVTMRRNTMKNSGSGGLWWYHVGQGDQNTVYPVSPEVNPRSVVDFLGMLSRETGRLKQYRAGQITKQAFYGDGVANIFDYQDYDPNPTAWGHTGKRAYFSVYVDEYFYDTNPMTGGIAHWREFVNKKPRKITFYKNRLISKDGKSIYYKKPFLHITQRPIYTYFNPENESSEALLFGVESVNELGPKPQVKINRSITHHNVPHGAMASGDDGWLNSIIHWDQKFRPGGVSAEWGYMWNRYYESISGNDLNFDKKKYYGAESRWNCFHRNRDTNRNGKIDPEECKWYIPAIDQLIGLYLGALGLPEDVRLYRNADAGKPVTEKHYISSTELKKNESGYADYTSYLWAEQGASTSVYQEGNYNASGNFQMRCVRNLRRLSNTSDTASYHGRMVKLSKYHAATASEPAYVDMHNANNRMLRTLSEFVISGELPSHGLMDEPNRPYGQFYVSEQLVSGSYNDHVTLLSQSPARSKCSDYTETRGGKTISGWRMPSDREMLFMIYSDMPMSAWSKNPYISATKGSPYWSSSPGYSSLKAYSKKGSGEFHIYNTESSAGGTFYVRCVKDKK